MHTAHRRSRQGSSSSRHRTFSSSAPHRRTHSGARTARRQHTGQNRHSGNRAKRKNPSFDPSQFINTNPAPVEQAVYTSKNSFETFGLDGDFARAITKTGLATPTPIQDQIIPEILNGHDVIGLAETGTGKTAAFLIPLIQKTVREPRRQTLILAPTRELAQQIESDLKKLTRGMRLYSVICVGGTNINPQMRALRRPTHFVIGTPGRVLDLINRGSFTPKTVTTVVLDEADRMLDMGFVNDMRAILSETPKNRETLLFSATMSGDMTKLVNEFLHDPVSVSVKKSDVAASVAQDVVRFDHAKKFETLVELLKQEQEFDRVLVFGAMKHSVEKLARQLSKAGVRAESIHGNKNQAQRQRALDRFKRGDSRVLVATDVAARGIHVDRISHVINYDLPNTFDDYVHRIGRTGRGSERGKALTFVPVR